MIPHPSVLVDLDALCANYRMLAGPAGAAKTAAVVKCNAYGLGLNVVGPELAVQEDVTTFFVTYAFEGAGLRKALGRVGKYATIFVFNGPDEESISAFSEYGLAPVLNSAAQARLWARAHPAAAAALHIDTGMNRLGAPAADVKDIAKLNLNLSLVMSHLACSSDPAHPMNAEQLGALKVAAVLFPGAPLSIAASGGALLGPEYRLDLIRPGAALYGVSPFDVTHARIKPVATLRAPVLQLRDAAAGQTAGYGASKVFTAPARLATVAIGYGDGFPRAASNRGSAFLGGALCPVAGCVSMDLVILDVTNAPQAVEIGDQAEFFGAHLPIEDAARTCATIGYELLTGLGGRIERRYLRSGQEIAAEG